MEMTVSRETPEILDPRGCKETLETLVLRVQAGMTVFKEAPGTLETLDRQVKMDKTAPKEIQDRQVKMDKTVPKEIQDRQVKTDRMVLKVPKEIQDL
jgi:hypothetical protein